MGYKVEVGILLTEDDAEFSSYNHVYTKDYGFFDEDNTIYRTYEEAVRHANEYVKAGVERT